MANIVAATCGDRGVVTNCINDLLVAGLAPEDIGLVMRDREASRELAGALGVRAGLISGGAAGFLEEIREWIEGLAHPGQELGLWGADLVEKLEARSLSSAEARRCRDEVNAGAILLTVSIDADELGEVCDLLGDCDATVIAPLAERFAKRRPIVANERWDSNEGLPSSDEVAVGQGEGQTRSNRISLGREELTIERRPADRISERGIIEIEIIHIPLREERVQLIRQPRVVEELVIRKSVISEERQISGTDQKGVPTTETAGDVERAREQQPPLKEREAGKEET